MRWRAICFLVVYVCGTAAQNSASKSSGQRAFTVEKIIGNLSYASAVVWDKDHLLIADLVAGKIIKVDAGGSSVSRDNIHAAALASDSEGRLYVCEAREHRLIRIDRKGKVEVLASEWEGKPLLGPTGLTVGKGNSVWFTDASWATEDRAKPRAYYGVFHISGRGELSLVAQMRGRPNGIAISADGKTLLVVDSDARNVVAWDIDRTGVPSNQRVLLKIRDGVPNGVALGSDGTIYVAAREIERFTPSGQPLPAIRISEKPADITFGDAQNTVLYVAAKTGAYRVHFAEPSGDAKGGGSN